MAYKVVLRRGLESALAAVNATSKPHVTAAIAALAENQRPLGVPRTTDVVSHLSTVVAGYRIAYMVQDNLKTVLVDTITRVSQDAAPTGNPDRLTGIQRQIIEWVQPSFPDMYVNNSGQLIIPFGSTAVLIDVMPLPSGLHRVYLTCPVLVGVPPSGELAALVGMKAGNFQFGSLGLRPEDESPVPPLTVEFEYSVHFEGTAQAPLIELITLIAGTGLELAGELRSRFGGETPM